MMNFEALIKRECSEICSMLLQKNYRYGNSVFEPMRIFSRASDDEQIKVRIDDKLSRLRTSGEQPDEDTLMDLVGYLVILMAKRRARKLEAEA